MTKELRDSLLKENLQTRKELDKRVTALFAKLSKIPGAAEHAADIKLFLQTKKLLEVEAVKLENVPLPLGDILDEGK